MEVTTHNLLIILLTVLSVLKPVTSEENPNKALFEFIAIEIVTLEKKYIIQLPKNISHSFNVSFVFPNEEWKAEYADQNHDSFYCFKDRLKRRLQDTYYTGYPEYVDATIIEFRNESTYYSYITADFTLHFIKTIPWPAWDEAAVKALFPTQLQGLSVLFPYPPINSSYEPFVNYTKYEVEWFEVIKDQKNMFGSVDAFAYFGYYNYTPPGPQYSGPQYFAIWNLILYGFIGFNIFVILSALTFWGVNRNRQKLLMSYWFKEELRKGQLEVTPSSM